MVAHQVQGADKETRKDHATFEPFAYIDDMKRKEEKKKKRTTKKN